MAKYTNNPWMEIQGMKEKMDKLMDEVRERFDIDDEVNEKVALWQPITDAYETPNNYVVQMELPGLERDQIHLEIKRNELWIYGERRMVKDLSGSSYQIMERSYGPFARKLLLPQKVNQDKIKAIFQNGLLTITLPKEEISEGLKKIDINSD